MKQLAGYQLLLLQCFCVGDVNTHLSHAEHQRGHWCDRQARTLQHLAYPIRYSWNSFSEFDIKIKWALNNNIVILKFYFDPTCNTFFEGFFIWYDIHYLKEVIFWKTSVLSSSTNCMWTVPPENGPTVSKCGNHLGLGRMIYKSAAPLNAPVNKQHSYIASFPSVLFCHP